MRGRHLTRSSAPFLIALCALAAALGPLGCGGGGDSGDAAPRYSGTALRPPRPAPALALRDSLGRPVNLRQFRGKAALVTFVYSHCPDVCPLIVSHLKTAQAELGRRVRGLQIIAVSTDPRGDTPRAVTGFLKVHGMTGRMLYLLGDRRRLQRTWRAWDVVARADPTDPEFVEHSAPVFGITASGRLTTVYSPNFRPAQIVHDVPLLASR
jgi:protein SCO1/2